MLYTLTPSINTSSRVVATAMRVPNGIANDSTLVNGSIIGNTILVNAADAQLNISPNLRSYAFDYSLNGYIVSTALKSAIHTLGIIAFETVAKTAKYGASYTDVFYNRIWLIPTSINVDGAPQQYSTSVVVWNSYFSDVNITSVTPNNLQGINITGITSGTYKPLESKTYVVSLSSGVNAVVNGYYQFNFSNAEDPKLPVFGTISLAFPYKHNWSSDYVETYSIKSGVLESHNGKEQTFKLSANPRRSLSMDVLLADNTTSENINIIRSKFYNSMAYGKAKSWIVPLWADVQILGSNLAVGSTVINIPTSYYDFKVGGYVYIYRKHDDYEIGTITNVSPNSITLSAGVQKSWNSGTYIVPAIQAKIQDDSIKGNILNYGIESFNMVWAAIPKENSVINKISNYVSELYDGFILFLWKHNFTEDPTVEIYSPNRILDNEVGSFIIDPRYNFTRTRSSFSYLLKNREEISKAIGFFKAVNGKNKPFWIPTYANEIQIVEAGSSGSNLIKIRDIGYSSFIKQNPNQRDIILIKTDGTYVTRRIESSTGNGDGTESLVLNQPMGFNWATNSFREGHFLKLVRLDQDSLEVVYVTNTIANISFVMVDSIQA